MSSPVTAVLIAVAFAALAGCGQMGPLYMPPDDSAPEGSAEQPPSGPSGTGSS